MIPRSAHCGGTSASRWAARQRAANFKEQDLDRELRKQQVLSSLFMLADLLNSVLLQQPEHSAKLTPAMSERGQALRSAADELKAAFPKYPWAKGLSVECRDGTGGKSRVPWIRVYNPDTSPSSTEGWYVVILFAANGEHFFVSLNQGTSRWQGKNVIREPLDDIQDRTDSAIKLLGAKGMLPPSTTHSIRLRDRHGSLGEGYEIGNVAAFVHGFGAEVTDEQLFDQIRILEEARSQIDCRHPSFSPGVPYVSPLKPNLADENANDYFTRDPAKLERALITHHSIQEKVAEIIGSHMLKPLSPEGEPDFDIAWQDAGTFHIVEVKSLPPDGEISQIRIGLGQLLHYRALLKRRYPHTATKLILALEHAPAREALWASVAEESNICISWGPDFKTLRALAAASALPKHAHGTP